MESNQIREAYDKYHEVYDLLKLCDVWGEAIDYAVQLEEGDMSPGNAYQGIKNSIGEFIDSLEDWNRDLWYHENRESSRNGVNSDEFTKVRRAYQAAFDIHERALVKTKKINGIILPNTSREWFPKVI